MPWTALIVLGRGRWSGLCERSQVDHLTMRLDRVEYTFHNTLIYGCRIVLLGVLDPVMGYIEGVDNGNFISCMVPRPSVRRRFGLFDIRGGSFGSFGATLGNTVSRTLCNFSTTSLESASCSSARRIRDDSEILLSRTLLRKAA